MYTQQQEAAVRECVDALPDALRQHAEDFVALKMTVEEVQAFVATARRTGHEWWVSAVDEQVAGQLEVAMGGAKVKRGMRDGSEHVTTIRCALSEVDKNILRTEYMGVTDLVFQSGGRGEPVDHAKANASRTIASVQMRRMIPRGARVMEIGAKPEHAVMFGAEVGKYMGVMPVIDAHDVQRHSQSVRNVRLMVARKGAYALKDNQREVAKAYLDRFETMFTRKKVQEVVWPADVVVSLESNYDVPMTDVPGVMHRTGATMWVGSMTRCPAACVFSGRHKGHLRVPGFDYEIDAERDTVSFFFRSSARPYKHKLSVYRDYMMYANRTFKCKGAQYVYVTLPQSVPSQLMFAFYRVPDRPYVERRFTYLPTGGAGRVRVSTAVAGEGSMLHDVGAGVFEVEEDEFSRVLQDRMLGKRDMDDGEVIRLVRGARLGMVVNGVRLKSESSMATSLIKPLAVAINVLAKDMFVRGDRTTARANAIIKAGGYRRAGLWHTAFDAAFGATSLPGAFVGVLTERIRSVMNTRPSLKVEHVPAFQRVDAGTVSSYDGCAVFDPVKCTCEEIGEAEAIRCGDRGGLSADEARTLDKYIELLRSKGCDAHDFDATRVTERGEMCGYDGAYLETSTASAGSDTIGGSDSDCDSDDGEFVDSREWSTDSSSDCEPCGQQYVPPAEGPVRDAIEEYVDILERQMDASDSAAVKWSGILVRGGVEESVLEAASDGKLTHHVLKVCGGLVVGIVGRGEDAQSFKRAYDFGRQEFFDVKRVPGTSQCYLPRNASSEVYVSSAYLVRNQPDLVAASMKVLANPVVGPVVKRITFVNGCFGCGKTTEIIAKYRKGNVYLTSTRNSADSVRKRLYCGAPEGKELVRTFDSAVCRGVPKADVLLMDEVPMSHAGQVFVAMEMVQPKEIVGYGDFFQIPYIPFLAAYKMKAASLAAFCEIQVRMINHRCRVSICAAVINIYGLDSGLGVCRCCEHIQESEEGFDYHKITSINQIPLQSGVKYIALTQKEKFEMQGRLTASGLASEVTTSEEELLKASTVHEVQGETYDEVIGFRTVARTKPDTIYFSKPHALVAITRAKKRFRWYTTSNECDAYSRAYQDSRNEQLRRLVRKNSGL